LQCGWRGAEGAELGGRAYEERKSGNGKRDISALLVERKNRSSHKREGNTKLEAKERKLKLHRGPKDADPAEKAH